MTRSLELTHVHVRALDAAALDQIRPFARRHGYRPSIADSVRFAVDLTARLAELADDNGRITAWPDSFPWPAGLKAKQRETLPWLEAALKPSGRESRSANSQEGGHR